METPTVEVPTVEPDALVRAGALDSVRGWLRSPTAEFIWRIVAAISLVLVLFSIYQNHAFSSCIAAYNDAYNKSATARAAATAAADKALDAWIHASRDALRQPNGTAIRNALDDAYTSYFEARARVDQQRADAPLPPPPSQRC